ncbi:MAG: response regulator transcription factor [Bacteroidetes bacterium]|nr:response regulator transcription factor [Bacteroidota bacterium]
MNESMSLKPIRVLIADDHPVILEGLALLLKPAKNITVIGFARNAEELNLKAATLRPDVVILDVIIPNCLASNNIKALQKILPEVRIICCSGMTLNDQIRSLINAGIDGFVLKTAVAGELRAAVETVFAGGNYFSQEITDILIRSLRQNEPEKTAAGEGSEQFSDKELSVIRMICEEKSVKEMSEQTKINARTIESIKIRIMKKMSVHNVAGVVSYALRNKYISLDDLSLGS